MKLRKPFSSLFNLSLDKPLRERWKDALCDPAYLIIFISTFLFLIINIF